MNLCFGKIQSIANRVTSGDPAFSVQYPCTQETIYGTRQFEVYSLHYTLTGTAAYTVSFYTAKSDRPQFVFSRSVDNRIIIDHGIGGTRIPIDAYGDPGEFTIVNVSYRRGLYSFTLLSSAPFLEESRIESNSAITLLNYAPDLVASTTPFLTMQSSAGLNHYSSTERCNTFRPRITINAISTIDQQNFGEALYTVLDSEEYSDTVTCQSTLIGDSWQSVFSTFPEINLVVRGKGCSLQQKFRSLMEHYNLSLPMEEFTKNMATWALLKYILGRLLYGDFDLKYLSACFHQRFLRDLRQSRFSAFSRVFERLAKYNRYFKCVGQCDAHVR